MADDDLRDFERVEFEYSGEAAILEHHAGKPLPGIRAALTESLTEPKEHSS